MNKIKEFAKSIKENPKDKFLKEVFGDYLEENDYDRNDVDLFVNFADKIDKIEEVLQCERSFDYFCTNYVKYNSIPIIPYEYQKDSIKFVEENQYTLATKFRSAGISTITTAYLLWKFLFEIDKTTLVLSQTDRQAIGIGHIFNIMLKSLPDFLKPNLDIDNMHTKMDKNVGNIIRFHNCNPGRGMGCNYLYVDEGAFFEEEDWQVNWPMLSAASGRKFIISSSPYRGKEGWFYKTYKDIMDEKNSFKYFKIDAKYIDQLPEEIKKRFNYDFLHVGELGEFE